MIVGARVEGRAFRIEVRSRVGRLDVWVDGREVQVDLLEQAGGFMSLLIDGRSYDIGLEPTETGFRAVFPDDVLEVEVDEGGRDGSSVAPRARSGPARIVAPMPGRIVRVLVEAGQTVAPGQGLVVMEAMKMENEIRAPRAGRVREAFVREGQAVDAGAPLVVLE